MSHRDVVLWIGLVAAGFMLRMGFESIPNFAPVAAIALFAGYVFPNRLIAMTVPIAMMLLTDVHLGRYQLGIMMAVYLSLALPAVVGAVLQKQLMLRFGSVRGAAGSVLMLLGCVIGSSLFFFLVTNFAVWAMADLYPRSWAGMAQCYTQALPFYRFTLAGDVTFATALFGGLAVIRAWAASSETKRLKLSTANVPVT